MLRIALASLRGRKLRLALTTLSIVLGVSFVSGTYIFTDSIDTAFQDVFRQGNAGVAVTIRDRRVDAAGASGGGFGGDMSDVTPHRVPEKVLTDVRRVSGVDEAVGSVTGSAQLLDRTGKPIGGQGPPTLGFSWAESESMTPLRVTTGRAPERDGEIAIDVTSAKRGKYEVGDTMQVVFPRSDARFTIVGLVKFGKLNQLQGATLSLFELRTAQRVFETGRTFDAVTASAKEGVSQQALARRVRESLDERYAVLTGEQTTAEQTAEIAKGIGFFRNAMLVFAAVALFVGAFTIFNTFSIIVAQRTREFGLLRAVGATPRQVLGTVTVEGLVVGLVASLVGLAAGIGVSSLLRAMLDAFGATMPAGDLVVRTRTAVASIGVGVGVTVAAAVVPALRASRITPIEALRDGPAREGRLRRWVVVVGALAVAGGCALLAAGLFGGGSLRVAGPLIGSGFVVAIIGVAMLTPLLVAPVVRVIGSPLARLGVAGRLATRNARRNPRRTALTASALMIGLGLASFAAIFTTSLTHSVETQIDRAFGADFLLTNSAMGNGLAPSIAAELDRLPEVGVAVGFSSGSFTVGGDRAGMLALDTSRLDDVLDIEIVAGSAAGLVVGDVLVRDLTAREHGWKVGQKVKVRVKSTGSHEMRIAGTFEEIGLTDFLASSETFREWYPPRLQQHAMVMVEAAEGVTAGDAREAVRRALDERRYVKVQDQTELKAEQRKQAGQLLGMLYGLLALSLVIALFGIVNTLALSVFERTREIGLLRAVGMTRWQARRMVAAEAVVIATLGSLLGIALGLSLGWAGVRALADEGLMLAIPGGFVAVLAIVGAVAGLLAAIAPARRAARLDVLDAIATE